MSEFICKLLPGQPKVLESPLATEKSEKSNRPRLETKILSLDRMGRWECNCLAKTPPKQTKTAELHNMIRFFFAKLGRCFGKECLHALLDTAGSGTLGGALKSLFLCRLKSVTQQPACFQLSDPIARMSSLTPTPIMMHTRVRMMLLLALQMPMTLMQKWQSIPANAEGEEVHGELTSTYTLPVV